MNEQIKIIISAEVEKFKQGMANAKTSLKDFVSKNKEGFNQTKDMFSKASSGIINGAKAMSTALVGAGASILALGASTQEYRNEQAKLVTAFESAGSSAEQAKTTYNDLYRVLGDSGVATEASAHLAKLTQDQKSLSEWTNICQGVYATFGDSLPIESLTEASNETAKTGQLTGGLADALNWAGVSEEAFQEKLEKCNSEAEREKLIRETLNGIYDESAKKFEENNAQVLAQNEAQAKLQETMAQVGEAVAPINTAFTEFGVALAEQVAPYIQQFAEEYAPKLKEVLEQVAEKVGEVISWIVDNWDTIKLVATIIGAIASAILIVNGALTALSAVMAVVNFVMSASPITWIIMGITALIAIIIVCIAYWDEIKEAIGKAWDWIKKKTGEAVDAVVKWFTEMKEKVVTKATEIKDKAKEKFEEIKQNISDKVQQAKQAVVDKFNEIRQTIQDKVEQAKQAVVDKFNAIKQGITDKINQAKTSVVNTFNAIKTGITEKVNAVKTTVTNTFNAVKEAIMTPINTAKGLVEKAIDKIKGAFDFDWELPKPKLPHFSVSGGEAPWGFMGKGSLPKVSIDWYAKGGVFDSPTLFSNGGQLSGLGEDGAEAIVPLEKNTEWMNVLADELSSRMGTGQNIVMQVDGKTFAEVSVNSINQLTKQRGSLPLKLY